MMQTAMPSYCHQVVAKPSSAAAPAVPPTEFPNRNRQRRSPMLGRDPARRRRLDLIKKKTPSGIGARRAPRRPADPPRRRF